MLLTLVVFIVILGLLIFVHELGHFLAAKRAGIKVLEFAFGFPPRLFALKRDETEYALNLIPLGGYVRMLGEEEDITAAEKRNPRSFAHQPVWTRAKVVVAGVAMNVVLGWLLISVGFMFGMAPVVTQSEQIPLAKVTKAIVITAVGEKSAALAIGLRPGDLVTEFNGQSVATKEALADLTKSHQGQSVTLNVLRGKERLELSGQLGQGEAPLGVALADDVKVKLPFWWAPVYSVWETVKAGGLIFKGVLVFFKDLFTERQIPQGAAGPVGIFYFTRSVLELGPTALLNFVAVLSVNLAIINILPIPALDGGRLLFILLEQFNRGRKVVNQQIENLAHTIGFALLILLILVITYQDILRLGR